MFCPTLYQSNRSVEWEYSGRHLSAFTSCHQRDYRGPPHLFAFSDSLGTDQAPFPIPGPFLVLRLEFTHNF